MELRRETFRPALEGSASRPPKRTIRGVVGTASVLFGAIVLGLLGTGGTYAYLNSVETVSAGTVSAGTMSLSVGHVTHSGPTALLPGQSSYLEFPLTNVGDVPATVSGVITFNSEASPFSRSLTFSLAKTSCSASTLTTGLGSMQFSKGEVSTVCLRVQLPVDAPQSAVTTAPFTLTLKSVQGVNP